MARYNAGALTSAGSATLPIISLYNGLNGSASFGGSIREIGVSNTTGTAVALKLVRLTTAGTKGAALTAAKHNPDAQPAVCGAFNTHSGGPTITDDLGYRAQLGAGAGYGWVWSFGDTGLRIPSVGIAGIGVVVENGTGQACQAYIVWDE